MMTAGSGPQRGRTHYEVRDGEPRFLSDVIIELGLAAEDRVEKAVGTARSSGATVGEILIREGQLSSDELARALAARYGLDHVDLSEFEVNPEAANLLPRDAATRVKAVPVGFEPNGHLLVAMADPSDSLALSDVAFLTHLEVTAAVASEDQILDLAARLPLRPTQSGGSGLAPALAADVAGPATAPPTESAAAHAASITPSPPAADTAEIDQLRDDLDRAAADLERERAKHASVVEELRLQVRSKGAEFDALRSDFEATRAALDGVRAELDTVRSELDQADSDRDLGRSERDAALAERDSVREEHNAARAERDALRSDFEATRAALDGVRAELDTVRSELDQAHSDRDLGRSERDAALAERDSVREELNAAREELNTAREERDVGQARLSELADVERQMAETRTLAEKLREDLVLEREGHATNERELQARLASETERNDRLEDAHDALQKRIDALHVQNATLVSAYEIAREQLAQIARGAEALASSLEQAARDVPADDERSPDDGPAELDERVTSERLTSSGGRPQRIPR